MCLPLQEAPSAGSEMFEGQFSGSVISRRFPGSYQCPMISFYVVKEIGRLMGGAREPKVVLFSSAFHIDAPFFIDSPSHSNGLGNRSRHREQTPLRRRVGLDAIMIVRLGSGLHG